MPRGLKEAVWRITKCVSFLLIFIFLLSVLSHLFIPKSNDPNSGIKSSRSRGFYGEPRNSLDLICIGNSNMFSGFSPMELWKLYGFTGYNCGESGETIFEAYNMLSEVLACQKPKVVILDTDGVFPTGDRMDTFNKFIDFNLNRLFPVIYYHNRWKTMRDNEAMDALRYTWTTSTRGYQYDRRVKSFSGRRPNLNGPVVDRISAVTRVQLDAFQSLCKKSGAHLVLVYIPTAFSWDRERHDLMAKYAAEHGLPFLDLNTDADGFQVNWQDDSLDGGTHLNYFGAKRVSLFLGAYLHQRYPLPDHRKDDAFRRWNEDYEKYIKIVQH